MRVLYLSAWYPSEKDEMAGLFVRKHADAVRKQGVDVKVLDYENIPRGWRPDLIQLNVLSLKNALRTYWLHWRYRVPYIVVEHWTRYLPISLAFPKNRIEGLVLRFVAKHASMILPVSENLMHAMQDCGIRNNHWQVIHNVVDDFFFAQPTQPAKPVQPAQPIQLLHVSCFDEPHKNVCGILRVADALWKQRQDWHLTIIGIGPDYEQVRTYARSLSLPESAITWTGELTPEEVCDHFKKADVFVLFSNTENAPVVISESLAAGCPIVSSDVGGIAEMVNQDCGILVPARDEAALLNAVNQVMDHPEYYDAIKIQSYGLQYSYANVSKQLMTIYANAVNQ